MFLPSIPRFLDFVSYDFLSLLIFSPVVGSRRATDSCIACNEYRSSRLLAGSGRDAVIATDHKLSEALVSRNGNTYVRRSDCTTQAEAEVRHFLSCHDLFVCDLHPPSPCLLFRVHPEIVQLEFAFAILLNQCFWSSGSESLMYLEAWALWYWRVDSETAMKVTYVLMEVVYEGIVLQLSLCHAEVVKLVNMKYVAASESAPLLMTSGGFARSVWCG